MTPPAKHDQFEAYLALLDRWNRTHALTALRPEDRHEELILDSLQLAPWLESLPPGAAAADFGTGMGVPAVVLAILRPDLRVLALDKVGKKISFVRQATLELGLKNLEPIQGDATAIPALGADLGVAKAVGDLSLLLGWWKRHGLPNAPFLALKGPDWTSEALPEGWTAAPHPYVLPTRGARVVLELARSGIPAPR